jgi:hypothetical protein
LNDKEHMPTVDAFSDEQARVLINLDQQYEVWIEASRELAALPFGLRWATRSGRDYLYKALDRHGNAKSLGPRSAETEARFVEYHAIKQALKNRVQQSAIRLNETCRLYRSLRLPLITSDGAKILREADKRKLLGPHVIVVGTNAMPAYAIEAGGTIADAPDETLDFDLAVTAEESDGAPVWAMLQAVDDTYTVNMERPFQARNASAYEVELLTAPSRIKGMARLDRPRPFPLPEQEWLLLGRQVSHVVVARDGSPARIVAPDPRWFALQKMWMSEQEKRNPLKRPKDAKQGRLLLEAVREAMPQFPLDEEFEGSIPPDLMPFYETWKATAGNAVSAPDW